MTTASIVRPSEFEHEKAHLVGRFLFSVCEIMQEDFKEKVERYLKIEEEALSKIRIIAPKDSYLEKIAQDNITMIKSYFDDAKFFYSKGDLVNAFAALNYSYGWIDSGVRLGIFDGSGDHRLFTLYK